MSWRPSAQLAATEHYGRYEILGRIGRGGMAEILLARERSRAGTVRHLVVKRILPENAHSEEMLQMFLAEARVCMGLSHPNLCQIYEVGEQDGTWFLAMEWVNGVTLHQLAHRAAEFGFPDYGVLARIISQCAEALHYAHTARDGEGNPLYLVHRDVSPHNLMVGFDGRVKLLDFGIAKSTASTHHTETGIVKGKVCYMAPEQWLGDPLDGRTDVFALGACLYEALTGEIAFRRDTQAEVMRAVLSEPVRPISDYVADVPEGLVQIVHLALAKEREQRFQSALEMSEALERFVTTLAEPVHSTRVAQYVRRLFRMEVELGPMLERAIRGADLEPALALPPPAPRGMFEEVTFTGALPRLLGSAPLPAPPPVPAPSEPLNTPSEAPVTAVGALRLARAAARAQSAASEAVPPAAVTGKVATFSEAPTRPLGGLTHHVEEAPRGPLRTVSMHVGQRRRVAVAGVAALISALSVVTLHRSWSQRESRAPQESAARSQGAPHAGSLGPVAPQAGATGSFGVLEASPLSIKASSHAEPPSEAVAPVVGSELAEPLTIQARAVVDVPAQGGPEASANAEAPPDTAPAPEAAANAETPPDTAPTPEASANAEAPPDTAPAPAASAPGKMRPENTSTRLSINTRPWSTVYLGKRVLGTTPLADVAVPSGALRLKFVDRDGRVHMRRVAPAKRKRVRSVFYDFERAAR